MVLAQWWHGFGNVTEQFVCGVEVNIGASCDRHVIQLQQETNTCRLPGS